MSPFVTQLAATGVVEAVTATSVTAHGATASSHRQTVADRLVMWR